MNILGDGGRTIYISTNDDHPPRVSTSQLIGHHSGELAAAQDKDGLIVEWTYLPGDMFHRERGDGSGAAVDQRFISNALAGANRRPTQGRKIWIEGAGLSRLQERIAHLSKNLGLPDDT
jgi:hypothetical protein